MSRKTIVVSGASRGIGFGIAKKFYYAGWNVAACARNISPLTDALKSENQQTVLLKSCDVSDKNQVKDFGAAILETFDSIDVLVNNAGIFLPGAVHEEPEGTLENLMTVNLYSAYHLSRMLIPKMKEQRSGSIFNVCSIASMQAYPNGGSYSISKFALHGFSKALREELKPHNIRVTSLLPGATLTDSWAGSGLPDTRFMKVDDIADLVFNIYHLSSQTVVEDIVLRPILGDI